MFPFQTKLGLVMEWGEEGMEGGAVEELLMSDKAFLSCLTYC